jgi:hypothetical protein
MRQIARLVAFVFAVAGAAALAADPIADIVDPYLRVQASLTADELDPVKSDAEKVAAGADTLGQAGQPIATAARELQRAGDLKSARASFGKLSDLIIAYAEATRTTLGDGVKVAYCPMVKKSWLQKDGTIQNPYYGKDMPGCGEFRK